ncbi:M23 family metallopeptidase [Aliiruegeria sabulilitoris]|uniref:M23 family metallopeptidase n=1 Tax=Aliiruegeria sabulilitoris TaxID=1510458 RepID=UPI00082EA8DB|nr:M23 family metallopeptidase [Aliiruegeria sabulilitoris]
MHFSPAFAQDEGAEANLLFAETVRLHAAASDLEGDARRDVLRAVLEQLQRIGEDYPTSIPGKRIAADEALGAIDIAAIRKELESTASASDKDTSNEPMATPRKQTAANPSSSTKGHFDQTVPWEKNAPAGPRPSKDTATNLDLEQWHRTVVPNGFAGVGFGHGEFPSIGQRTHPGVDIVGDCGLDVVAPYPGTVTRTVKAGDADYELVGNAVLIDHGKVEGVDTWTFFSNLSDTPFVEGGAIALGTVIGQTGESRHATGCHLHFEVRNFTGRGGVVHPEWNRMLAYGDWSTDSVFLSGWTDPEGWLKARAVERAMIASGGAEFVSKLAYYAQPRNFAFRGKEDQGLDMRMKLSAHWAPDGLHVSIDSFIASFVPKAKINPIGKNDVFTTEFLITASKKCDGCSALHSERVPSGMTFENGRLSRLKAPVRFIVGNEMLRDADQIGVTLVGGWKTVFLFSDALELAAPWEVAPLHPRTSTWRRTLTTALQECLKGSEDVTSAVSMQVLFAVDGQPIPSSFLSGSAINATDELRRKILYCATEGFDLPRQEYADWKSVSLAVRPGTEKGETQIVLE